ncbi:S-layer homology domain-containing protein [Cohnella ginsengisoli]|uniref:S-layer homology domain-containing protein n=1 Tax=Cohnella ginsengisoli TaxID=425004 RepID=A0A9X4KML3_9BACL|nr:S-layer homology domain-containing protein [Cohnella ginsengisoli]MDG0795119.1 S-layer homology domain-containing protein [Cohnella ginsengisoli]
MEPDGSVRHVPTQIVVIENQYFAKVNSLTNSTYSLVYHPVTFVDVDRHWAKVAVNDMGSRMVINGIGNDLFNPDQSITRAEFAAIMVRGLGLKSTGGDTSFSDVKTTDWFSGAIQTLYQYKLMDGFEDGTFRPTDNITREQAMKMIAQAMVLTDLKSKLFAEESAAELKPFTDGNTVAEWAKTSVADVIQAGIITGRSPTTLAPKANISRAEVAVIIRKLLQQSGLI